ncbi:MAG: shikimate kinase [Frankiales bacterium]|nr:shikimate kinase [Frankiales bacterium]MDX6212620.1 shikimate kinase [Frankiales bacterium]
MSAPIAVIVGAPGSGKTTVGREVARALGVGFRDTDADVVAATGRTVADIFLVDGEDAFRRLEATAVAEALAAHDGILALGGGAVLDETTRELLAGHRVVFLDVGLADAASRVGMARDRPLLLGNPRGQLLAMLDARRPVYQQVATVTVPTDGREVAEVTASVLAALS